MVDHHRQLFIFFDGKQDSQILLGTPYGNDGEEQCTNTKRNVLHTFLAENAIFSADSFYKKDD